MHSSRCRIPRNRHLIGSRTPGVRPGGSDTISTGVPMTQDLTAAKVQEMILSRPFHQWLGLEVLSVGDETIELKAKWREEWVVNPQGGWTHGGILAALVDLTADWAMIRKLGRPAPTVDMRVDYHSPATKGDLVCRGRIVRLGGQFS